MYDGNNNLVVLAFAEVDGEDADNLVWFKQQLEQDMPGIAMWMSDANKGITSSQFALSMSQSTDQFVLS
jgi:hypothetical protein